jgi:hypothetical protein
MHGRWYGRTITYWCVVYRLPFKQSILTAEWECDRVLLGELIESDSMVFILHPFIYACASISNFAQHSAETLLM